MYIVFFFFFQAEDGIRDATVTGVQTCALPICHWRTERILCFAAAKKRDVRPAKAYDRSEERRVGKECRSRWSPDPEKKKTRGVVGVCVVGYQWSWLIVARSLI